MAGRIAVVDAENRFLRWEERPVIHRDRLPHRSIHVLVFDGRDRLVIQRRHPDKDTFPGHWDTSCAGHVEESDYPGGDAAIVGAALDAVYADVAARELEEELGVAGVSLTQLCHFGPEPQVHYEELRLFRATSDGPYRLQPDEVTEVRPVTRAEFDALEASADLVTPTLSLLVRWLEEQGGWA